MNKCEFMKCLRTQCLGIVCLHCFFFVSFFCFCLSRPYILAIISYTSYFHTSVINLETHLDWLFESPPDWRFAQPRYRPEVCPWPAAQSHPQLAASGLQAHQGSANQTRGPPTSCCCRLNGRKKSDATVSLHRHLSLVPSSNQRCPHSLSRNLRRSDLDSVACRRRHMRCQCSSRRRTWTDNWNSGRYTLWAPKKYSNHWESIKWSLSKLSQKWFIHVAIKLVHMSFTYFNADNGFKRKIKTHTGVLRQFHRL